MTTKTFEAVGIDQVLSARMIEKQLSRLRGVRSASASYGSQTATVTYDKQPLDADATAAEIRACGLPCRGELLPEHVCAPQDSARPMAAHAEHEAPSVEAGRPDEMGHEMGRS